MLYVFTGVRGSGKTTLLEGLKRRNIGTILQPSTTRPPRFDGESEYDFVTSWEADKYAWAINVGDKTYGMRKSEIDKAQTVPAFTVFEPISIGTFYEYRKLSKIPSVVVGLDTVPDLVEQRRRVGMSPARIMTADTFQLASIRVRAADICIAGNEAEALQQILDIIELKSRV